MKRVHGIAASIGSSHGLREKGRRFWCAYQTIVHKVACPVDKKVSLGHCNLL